LGTLSLTRPLQRSVRCRSGGYPRSFEISNPFKAKSARADAGTAVAASKCCDNQEVFGIQWTFKAKVTESHVRTAFGSFEEDKDARAAIIGNRSPMHIQTQACADLHLLCRTTWWPLCQVACGQVDNS